MPCRNTASGLPPLRTRFFSVSIGTKRASPDEASSIMRSSSSRSWLARSISALE
jgi:hypothetical protein